MRTKVTVPDTYIKPTVRFGLTENEQEVLKMAQNAMQIIEYRDGEKEDILETDAAIDAFTAAQSGLLLTMRVFIGALIVGNTIEDAHMSVAALLTSNKDKMEEVALDWADPDTSELTGEELDTSAWPEPTRQIRNILMRANSQFRQCVLAVPSVIRWTRMGIDLGLEPELVKDASGSLLDFREIFGDYECGCPACKGELEV